MKIFGKTFICIYFSLETSWPHESIYIYNASKYTFFLAMFDRTGAENQWDYMQKNCDRAALESFKGNLWVLIAEKVLLSNQKTEMFRWSLARGYQTI